MDEKKKGANHNDEEEILALALLNGDEEDALEPLLTDEQALALITKYDRKYQKMLEKQEHLEERQGNLEECQDNLKERQDSFDEKQDKMQKQINALLLEKKNAKKPPLVTPLERSKRRGLVGRTRGGRGGKKENKAYNKAEFRVAGVYQKFAPKEAARKKKVMAKVQPKDPTRGQKAIEKFLQRMKK